MPVMFKYVGDDEREIPDARIIVKPGDTFEVSDEIAKGLDGQSLYEKATKPKPKAKDGDE
jgi:hypothetical protein